MVPAGTLPQRARRSREKGGRLSECTGLQSYKPCGLATRLQSYKPCGLGTRLQSYKLSLDPI